jgi:tyrosine-protein phosphatase SIW14
MKTSSASLLFASLLACGPILAAQPPAGVPNFQQVNEHIYRGAQPNTQGFQSLASLGVKTVIDLRGGGGRSADERKVVEAAGMRYVAIPLDGYSAPTDRQVSNLLGLLNDESAGPVFVHCRRGADRTGTIIACYRISHDHWQNRKALVEAAANGMSWTEIAMKHYVLGYKTTTEALAAVPTAVAAQ